LANRGEQREQSQSQQPLPDQRQHPCSTPETKCDGGEDDAAPKRRKRRTPRQTVAELAASGKFWAKPRFVAHLLDEGLTSVYSQIAKGELLGVKDGRSTKIPIEGHPKSVKAHIERKIAEAEAKLAQAQAGPGSKLA
jgi:hypothetical protein